MDKSQTPIGMLDSGLGGLTVLRTAMNYLPNEQFIYLADFKHSPFGGRTKAELVNILSDVVETLLKRGVKALVFASNTATSAAIETFRASLSIPVVGLEPALKPAVQITPRGQVLVLATELTLREEKFQRLFESYKDQADIILKSCPGLVELIDAGLYNSEELDRYLGELFSGIPHQEIRTVVLGCTHYIIVKKQILKHLPAGVISVDGNEGVARQLEHVLARERLLNGNARVGNRVELCSTEREKIPLMNALLKTLM